MNTGNGHTHATPADLIASALSRHGDSHGIPAFIERAIIKLGQENRRLTVLLKLQATNRRLHRRILTAN